MCVSGSQAQVSWVLDGGGAASLKISGPLVVSERPRGIMQPKMCDMSMSSVAKNVYEHTDVVYCEQLQVGRPR